MGTTLWVDEEVGVGALLEVIGRVVTVGLGVQVSVVEMPPIGLTLGAGTRLVLFS